MATEKDIKEVSALLKPLSHPHRLGIVIDLYHDPCNVSLCQDRMNLPQSTISQHLRVLKDAGIVQDHRDGNKVCYTVVNDFVKRLIEIIEK